MSVRSDGNGKDSCQSEIRYFYLSLLVDEDIRGFQVSVNDSLAMTRGCRGQELVHDVLYLNGLQVVVNVQFIQVLP